MSDSWETEADRAERRARIAKTTPDQRLAALRRLQQFAYRAGAWPRAVEKKRREQENQWKSAKQ